MLSTTYLLSLLSAIVLVMVTTLAFATPLDDYINAPDPSFKFEYTGKSESGPNYTLHYWNLTSQTWLTDKESDRSVWTHDLVIIVPNELDDDFKDKTYLYITGGWNRDHPQYPGPKEEDIYVTAAIATKAKMICATLFQVPNQPIIFKNDPWHRGGRSEGAAIALTWWQFFNDPSNPNVILELPMAKSAVKALDALEEIIPKYNGGVRVTDFAAAGASKRGWTTWLAGAVDKRLKVIVPIVLDALNVHAFFHRQWKMYGAWTFPLKEYYIVNVTGMLDSPQFQKLMSIVDPWYYRERLTMPKLAINAVGDEFQMPDDQRHWVKDMPGVMDTIMVKNAEHSMITGISEVLISVTPFIQAHLNKVKPPTWSWNISANGTITVETSEEPISVDVSFADSAGGISANKRDFRWAALNTTPCLIKVFGGCLRLVYWTTTKKYLTQLSPTKYSASMPLQADGRWRGFMIELRFKNHNGVDNYYFTTPVSVIPNTYPFPDCHGAECYGTLC